MSEPGDESIRIHLVRIEGKQDLANERLGSLQFEVGNLRTKVHEHGNEITKIQAERRMLLSEYQEFVGETKERVTVLEDWQAKAKGVIVGGRALWIVVGAGGTIIVELFKHFAT